MKTRNLYSYPLKQTDYSRMTYDESPAHVGDLKYSVDFICEEGTPVYAAYDGVIVDIKSDSDIGGETQSLEPLGNFIEIKHPHDEYSEYEHLKKDSIIVKVGDNVKRGDLIGYSGATGWLAHLGPHVHFMVGVYGEMKDDYETLEIAWDTI